MAKATINVRVNPGLRKRLESKAESEGGSISSIVNQALNAYFDFIESKDKTKK